MSLNAGVLAAGVLGSGIVGIGMYGIGYSDQTHGYTRMVSIDTPLEMPGQPAEDLPSTEELRQILDTVADPSRPASAKSDYLYGGLSPGTAAFLDQYFSQAQQRGLLPLNFEVSDVRAAGPGAVDAAVTVTGPKMYPFKTRFKFLNENGWKLSKDSIEQFATEV